jgi:hypothetical protein
MFIAAGVGVSDREQGIASGIASTGSGVSAAIGLAVLVLVANWRIGGLTGEELRVASADGLSAAVLVIAAGIAVMVLVVLSLSPTRDRIPERMTVRGSLPYACGVAEKHGPATNRPGLGSDRT